MPRLRMTSNAERQRRFRQRLRLGLMPIRLDADGELIEALIREGLLDPCEASEPEKIAAAAQAFLEHAVKKNRNGVTRTRALR
jgi:hypothetical protein